MSDIELPDDAELTAIYKRANGEDVGKAQPLTTQRIFKAMRACALADREKRAQAAQGDEVGWQGRLRFFETNYSIDPWSRWREVAAGELDVWKRRVEHDPEHYELRPVYAHPPTEASKPVQACDHQYHYFGDQQKRRRCNRCNELEPVRAEAPTQGCRHGIIGYCTKCNEQKALQEALATKQAEAPSERKMVPAYRTSLAYDVGFKDGQKAAKGNCGRCDDNTKPCDISGGNCAGYTQPTASNAGEREGWKEAAIAWEVCASIHREWAKGKDALFKTRQADFVKHANDARAALAQVPEQKPMSEFDEAVAAADATLHHAIDHWQERALKAEAALLAQVPEQVAGDKGGDHVG